MTHDRSYWRTSETRALIEAARDSSDELAIALGERLEDLDEIDAEHDKLVREHCDLVREHADLQARHAIACARATNAILMASVIGK
jgi:phosphoribosyl-dephospho-CoA transferase